VIVRELPGWFGIPALIDRDVDDLSTLSTRLALDDDRAIGCLATSRHMPVASELYVLGLLPHYHRQGIGRQLLARAERRCATMAYASSRSRRSGRHVRARR